ncbi:MAG: hypothetical protein AB7K36_30295 [Chloroflexota bacterium]
MGSCHRYGYHHQYRCADCGEPLAPLVYSPPLSGYESPPREEYVRSLEEECTMLGRRLRELERELEAVRAHAQAAVR